MSHDYNSLARIGYAIAQVKTSLEVLENELEYLNRVVTGSRVFDNNAEALTIGDNVTFIGRIALPGSNIQTEDVTGTVCHISEHFVHVEVLKFNQASNATERKIVRRASRNLVKIGRNINVTNF